MRLSYAALPLAALTAVFCVTLSNAENAVPSEIPIVQPEPKAASVAPAPESTQQPNVEAEQQIVTQASVTPVRPKLHKHEVRALVDLFAREHGVPLGFARAVVHVESSYNPDATGRVGEVGLMQLKYATAHMMGFRGTRDELYEPAINLTWGMKYLAGAWKLGGKSICGAVIRYQGGHARRTHTSVSKRYCAKVRKFIAAS
jgi:soluble lytic murein transglycosylase-like protein